MEKINEIGEAYILLHMDCELRCKVCPYLGDNGACKDEDFNKRYGGGKKLDIFRLKEFVDELLPYRPKVITLSGGEPLNYEWWEEIAKYIKSKGIKVSLSTNGLYLDKFINQIIDYVDSININLGGTKEIIDKIRDPRYGFEEVVENIRKIDQFKKLNGQKKPEIRFIYVISDIGYLKMKEFYDFFRTSDIEINHFLFQHMMYITIDKLEKQKRLWSKLGFSTAFWEGFNIDIGEIDFDFFLEQIKYLEKFDNVSFSPKMTSEEIKLYYVPSRKNEIKRNIKCLAPWNQVDLYPNGDIIVCPDFVVGNIYENNFCEIWSNKKIKWLRNLLNKGKIFPGCNSCFYYYVSAEDPYKE